MAEFITGFKTDEGVKKYDYNHLGNLPVGVRRIVDIELPASGWEGDASPYSQVVDIEGITENSQVDLTPSVEQLVIFHDKDLAFVTENEDGVATVYVIGDKPSADYTIQATITEVEVITEVEE